MGSGIIDELSFLLHSFLLGIGMIIFYDIFRILRRLIPHKSVCISVEDMVYWIVCAVLIFLMLYNENDGIIRWFAVAGMTGGMFLYNWTISSYVTGGITWILQKIMKVICLIMGVFGKPFLYLYGKCDKIGNYTWRKVTKHCVRKKKGLKKKLRTLKIYMLRH